MYKGHLKFNIMFFNKVHVAQLVEHQTTDLRDVGSNPTVGKNHTIQRLFVSEGASSYQVKDFNMGI